MPLSAVEVFLDNRCASFSGRHWAILNACENFSWVINAEAAGVY